MNWSRLAAVALGIAFTTPKVFAIPGPFVFTEPPSVSINEFTSAQTEARRLTDEITATSKAELAAAKDEALATVKAESAAISALAKREIKSRIETLHTKVSNHESIRQLRAEALALVLCEIQNIKRNRQSLVKELRGEASSDPVNNLPTTSNPSNCLN